MNHIEAAVGSFNWESAKGTAVLAEENFTEGTQIATDKKLGELNSTPTRIKDNG